MTALDAPAVHTEVRSSGGRIYFADHLRAALTLLVVAHHLVLTFLLGPGAHASALAQGLGGILLTFDQAFFMGLFFLLSAYFLPPALDRKGTWAFLRDRFIRLFVPLAIYYAVLSQVNAIQAYVLEGTPFTWQSYLAHARADHLWFVQLLLIFVCAYAAWASVARRGKPSATTQHVQEKRPLPRAYSIAAFVIVLAAASFVIRLWFPVLAGFAAGGSEPVIVVLGFFSPSSYDLPQYIALFIAGILAYRRDWLRRVPGSAGVAGIIAVVVATLVLFPLVGIGGFANLEFAGGWHWQSFVYALWEAIFCVGICLALVTLFRSRFDRPGRVWNFLSRQAYVVYIFHLPLISCVVVAFTKLGVPGTVWFPLSVVVVPPLCFALAFAIRKLPGASRVV
jgi:peptidoglycan/LPS O-acetylase OafA/YrhL